jgi:hypothetical protein
VALHKGSALRLIGRPPPSTTSRWVIPGSTRRLRCGSCSASSSLSR